MQDVEIELLRISRFGSGFRHFAERLRRTIPQSRTRTKQLRLVRYRDRSERGRPQLLQFSLWMAIWRGRRG